MPQDPNSKVNVTPISNSTLWMIKDVRHEQLKRSFDSVFECLNFFHLIYLIHHTKFFVTLNIIGLAFDRRFKSFWAVPYQMETEYDIIINKQQQDT